jgi:hypothetical protein
MFPYCLILQTVLSSVILFFHFLKLMPILHSIFSFSLSFQVHIPLVFSLPPPCFLPSPSSIFPAIPQSFLFLISLPYTFLFFLCIPFSSTFKCYSLSFTFFITLSFLSSSSFSFKSSLLNINLPCPFFSSLPFFSPFSSLVYLFFNPFPHSFFFTISISALPPPPPPTPTPMQRYNQVANCALLSLQAYWLLVV